jgi:hypothetical protein
VVTEPGTPPRGRLHHVELWVSDLARAEHEWGWLLGRLGYALFQQWPAGRSWSLGGTYIVVERSPAMTVGAHDRLRPGLNHLALQPPFPTSTMSTRPPGIGLGGPFRANQPSRGSDRMGWGIATAASSSRLQPCCRQQ